MSLINKLSNNALKIIACLFMTIDHMGMVLFPQYIIFRILGRIAMPIFAFLIAEGCKYTKNKVHHFATIFTLGAIIQIVYGFVMNDYLMSILLTFSLSILTIYALQYMKKTVLSRDTKVDYKIISVLLFLVVLFGDYFLTNLKMFLGFDKVTFDYGFFGVLLPVIISLFDFSFDEKIKTNSLISFMDGKWGRIILCGIGCVLLSSFSGFILNDGTNIEWFCLISLIFLALYNQERGKWNMKYFFYLYYPAHIIVIEGIFMLINGSIGF